MSNLLTKNRKEAPSKEYLSILILNWKDITNPAAGGGTYYTHRVAQFLVERGHNVTLLCANYPGGQRRETIDGVNIIRVGNKYTVFVRTPAKFLRDLRNKFDLVIDEINVLPWLTPLYVKAPRIAFIHQITREALFNELNKTIASLLYLFEKIGLLFYRQLPFVTVSQSVKEELVINGIPRENIWVIPPGIDAKDYRSVHEKENDSPMVLYLGRLKKYKGVQYLIQAMEHVVTKMPKSRLAIVGDGDYRSELEELVELMDLQDIVSFHGYVSEREKIRLLKRAWVLVVPSVREGFGIVVIEAAASGTPTIGTNTTGLKDSIVDGKTGFLVPYGKPKILGRKICEILSDGELRKRLSKHAHKWAKNFGWEKTAEKFETVIQQEATICIGD